MSGQPDSPPHGRRQQEVRGLPEVVCAPLRGRYQSDLSSRPSRSAAQSRDLDPGAARVSGPGSAAPPGMTELESAASQSLTRPDPGMLRGNGHSVSAVDQKHAVPAEAGTQMGASSRDWIPASAGTPEILAEAGVHTALTDAPRSWAARTGVQSEDPRSRTGAPRLPGNVRNSGQGPEAGNHNGILSCFFQGFSAFLFFRVRSARMRRLRVLRGWMTSSI